MFWIWSKYSWNLNIWVSLGSSFEICKEFEADLNLDLKKCEWVILARNDSNLSNNFTYLFYFTEYHCQLWQTGVKKSQLLKSRSKKNMFMAKKTGFEKYQKTELTL